MDAPSVGAPSDAVESVLVDVYHVMRAEATLFCGVALWGAGLATRGSDFSALKGTPPCSSGRSSSGDSFSMADVSRSYEGGSC